MRATRTSFTLIELLVVVAIIAILASMLLPALTKARQKARTVACLNQIKQMGMGCILYADGWDDFIPEANRRSEGGFRYWSYALCDMGIVADYDTALLNEPGVWQHYRCPEWKMISGRWRGGGYSINGMHSFGSVGWTQSYGVAANKRQNVARPDMAALLLDSDPLLGDGSSYRWAGNGDWASVCHSSGSTAVPANVRKVGGNICYVDGHAELRKVWYDSYTEYKFAAIYSTNSSQTGKWQPVSY